MSGMIQGGNGDIREEDALLVTACKKGDLGAFETLVRRYQTRMFTLCVRILGDRDDAAETVQESFLAAYRGLRGFRGEASFSTWLTTITVNLARNRLKQTRGRSRHEPYSLDDPLPSCRDCLLPDPPSGDPSAQELLEREEVRLRVQGCINGLEPGFREVLVLRDIEELSYGEVGAMLKLAEGTVKSRLFRARESVRDCLKKVLGKL